MLYTYSNLAGIRILIYFNGESLGIKIDGEL